MNKKCYSFDLETFRDMFQICPKVPSQNPLLYQLLAFMSDLGYLGNIKTLSEVKVDILSQPWRTFGTIINKCLSVVQKYGAILLDNLTNQSMKESEAYKTCYAFATRKEIPKPKYVHRSVKEKTEQAPKASSGKRIKSAAKAEQMNWPLKKEKHNFVALNPAILKSSDDEDDDDETSVNKDEDDDDQEDDDNQEDDEDQEYDDDQDERQDEQDSFVARVQTPSHVETTNDEDNIEENQDVNVEGDELDEDEMNEWDEGDKLYMDININSKGRDIDMTDSSSVSSGFISNILNPSPDTCIDFIFNLNTESTSLVDVPVTTIAEPPLLSATSIPLPPTPLITHLQQTHVPAPTTVPSSSLQDLPNFGSLFRFDDRLKTLEIDFSEFKQTNQFAKAVSSIRGIVDSYLANKINEAIKTADQVNEQVKAQVSKILPKIEKTINEQLEDEVLTRSSNASKTFHVVAANLSELELKKILKDTIESNKLIYIYDEQKNLYKALVEAYESDKLILDTYRDTGSKRRRARKEPESTSAPKDKTSKTTGKLTEGSKSHHKSAGKSAQAKEPMHTTKDLEEPVHQEFKIGGTKDQPDKETAQLPDWFQKLIKPPSPDHDWNKTLPDSHGPIQPWLSYLAQMEDPHESFNELMDTPLDFTAFVMNRLKVDTLTPELLTGLTFELMKSSCKSLPLPLIPNSRGRQVISFEHIINNDLAYLSVGISSQIYITLVKKTKAADYGHIKESARDVYSKRRTIAVTKLQIVECHNYKHLDWIIARRDDDKLYTFKEGDFNRLRIQHIEDMLLLLVQGKLTNLSIEERLAFNVSLRMFTRSIVIYRHVEDL
nr:hypothetical protein [Tanacetum cinerariifolium]